MDLDVAVAATGDGTARKLLKTVEDFHTYIDCNRTFIPNYGERCRYGERISTGFVESTVNQVISKRFCKKQQMQWTKRGAHLLLQIGSYSPPSVVVAPAPQVYVEPVPPPPTYWYYCDAAQAYYPYVQQCPGEWRPVLPTPPG